MLIVEFEEVTEAVLAAAPRLVLLGCCRNEPGASVDIGAATECGIPVLFTPGRNAVSVAEYTLGLMLSLARHIAHAHHLLRHTDELTAVAYADKRGRRETVTSEWSLDPGAPFARFHGPELQGRVLGLVGFGAIGHEIARRCQALGMELIVHDPYVTAEEIKRHGGCARELLELAQAADFLVPTAKVTPQTAGLISAEVIAKLKPGAMVINTARAALIDQDALVDALRERRIAGAALDVYPREPLPPASPLRALDNVVLSPHLAGASSDVPRHHSRLMVDDVVRAAAGARPIRLANPEVWERRRAGDQRLAAGRGGPT